MTGAGFVVQSAGRAPGPPDGRYEYRIWPQRLPSAVSRLQHGWPFVAAERRSDIYLLQPKSDVVLVKLRNGQRLEIKRRKRDVGTIQHWTMPVSTGFPLGVSDREALSEALVPRGELDVESGLSPAHLLAALRAQAPAMVAQPVRKSRLLFGDGDCRAEICRAVVGDWAGLTVALEAASLPSIAHSIDDLQFGRFPNRAYGEVLGPVFGPRPARPGLLIHAQPHERR